MRRVLWRGVGFVGRRFIILVEMRGNGSGLMRMVCEGFRKPVVVEGLEEGEDVGGGEALGAEGAEGEGVVALGEADAVAVAEEAAVEVGGGGVVEGALEEDLAGGGLEEVAAADDFGDVGEGVVDGTG